MDWIKNNSQPFVEYLLLISVFSSYFSDKNLFKFIYN